MARSSNSSALEEGWRMASNPFIPEAGEARDGSSPQWCSYFREDRGKYGFSSVSLAMAPPKTHSHVNARISHVFQFALKIGNLTRLLRLLEPGHGKSSPRLRSSTGFNPFGNLSIMALFTILRAAFGYLFLVLIVRIVGRRPGKQLTPFEFVLVFYLGGLTLTGMVGMEMSLTNAVCQIFTIALCHLALTWLRMRSDTFARVLDGSPLLLIGNGKWRSHTMSKMRLQDDDVMDTARERGIRSLSGIEIAVLEVCGEISIVPASKNEGQDSTKTVKEG
jgi:uncharacterized membrane protein YcaP (DUF421 family)